MSTHAEKHARCLRFFKHMYVHQINELEVLEHIMDRFGLRFQASRRITNEFTLSSAEFNCHITSEEDEDLTRYEIPWSDIRSCLYRVIYEKDDFEPEIAKILSSMSEGASILENPPIVYDNETFEDPNEGKPIIGYKAYEDDDRAEWFGFIEKLQGTPL